MKKKPLTLIVLILFFLGVAGIVKKFAFSPRPHGPIPQFNESYAFDMILKYENFGPKVPGTAAHRAAGDWIVQELKNLNLKVLEQNSSAETIDHHTIPIRNIIAQWNPLAKTRYLLSAHWDNRPFADNDPANKTKPVPGVNDGGSGVVVLLGIAKALTVPEDFGIDFAFWDAEDWGLPPKPDSYCLGSQYWAAHPLPEGYHAELGINYDMVGRSGSVFPIEGHSMQFAPNTVQGLRDSAALLGYQDIFSDHQISSIVDDHFFVTQGTQIPMVDLIYMTPDGHFAPEWHTINDTSEHISRDILKAVGQTTLQYLWTIKN